MADYRDDDRWKEYGFGRDMFPGGRTAPVASSEYMTAGMWDDYIRPGIKWLGDVIPGIGRSDTSSRKTIDESKKLLKDMRDSDLYLRRSEKDAEEEARKELERYLREVEERDKTFKDASLDGAGLDSATVAAIEADEAAGIWPEVASLGDAGLGWPRITPTPSAPSHIYDDSSIGGRSVIDPATGETLIWSMDKGRMAGPRGGAYELEVARTEEEDAALVAKAAIEADAWYASPEYAREEKLRESERKRPPKLTYWTKKDPWSVKASKEKYPDWHPLDTMPAWYTEYYPDPDAAALDALTVPEMKIWGIGPGIKDPLSGSEGGLSFMSPDKERTFSSVDMEKGKIPETPAMLALKAMPAHIRDPGIIHRPGGGDKGGKVWVTPEWLTPRADWGPKTLYEGDIDAALTEEILSGYKADDYTTRIGPMVIEKKATGAGMVDPPPEYYPTAYPDLAWYTSWADAERIAGYPSSWDYTDVVKDRMKMVADDPIFDPAAPWAEEVTDLDRLVGTFATEYRGEDPREYLEERTSPEYYPLPEYISGMHGPIVGGDDTDWYSKVIDDWYGGVGDSGRGYTLPMSRTSPEMMELLEGLRTLAADEVEPLDYDFGFTDYFSPLGVARSPIDPEGGFRSPIDTSRSSSTDKSRAIAKSWAEDYPFIDAAGGFERPELRDRAAAAYGYGPGPAEGMHKGWAATKAEEAFARPIATGAAGIKGGMTKALRDMWERGIPMSTGVGPTSTSRHLPGVADSSRLDALVSPLFDPDGGTALPMAIPTFGDPDKDVSDLMSSAAGASFADYIRKASPAVDPTYSIPDSAITKLWAEDIVRPAFGSLAGPMAEGFVSAPIDYTYLGSGTPWLTPSGEAPTLSFAVKGLYE